MTYLAKPKFHHPGLPKNALGYTRRDYEGSISTLCAGCGHNSISAAIIEACFELAIEPHRVAKLSGIGCSSKTPTYFLGNSHGFDSVHGRMPSVLTGANLANRDLIYLGVSGDGNSASIGFGQFAHAIRRAVRMVYIVENNGVYGLTKGQFSATADRGSKSKRGNVNADSPIDLVSVALHLGATFVRAHFPATRSSSSPHQGGDRARRVGLHRRAQSLRRLQQPSRLDQSYDYVRAHNEAVNRLDFVAPRSPIAVSYAPGSVELVEQHDGSIIALRKLNDEYDIHDRLAAMNFLEVHAAKGEIVTGLLYLNPAPEDLHDHARGRDALNSLTEKELCPGIGSAGENQCEPALRSGAMPNARFRRA